MTAKLKALDGDQTFPLGDFVVVGRGDDATLRLNDPEVSRQHASLRRDGAQYWLVDLGSANGSYVNEQALTGPRLLVDGDRLQFGNTKLRFEQREGRQATGKTVVAAKTAILWRKPAELASRPVTLLVGDIKGFTEISARLGATLVASLLREWYADCTAVLNGHGAAIDKFIGDCVFAYWHGTSAEICEKAVSAALALRAAERAASPTRLAVRLDHGIELDCRIGLHVGDAAIGAMGKGVNTALGDAVNIAFRIEALTRRLDASVLASSDFVAAWPEAKHRFVSRGLNPVKGRAEPVEVFSLAKPTAA